MPYCARPSACQVTHNLSALHVLRPGYANQNTLQNQIAFLKFTRKPIKLPNYLLLMRQYVRCSQLHYV